MIMRIRKYTLTFEMSSVLYKRSRSCLRVLTQANCHTCNENLMRRPGHVQATMIFHVIFCHLLLSPVLLCITASYVSSFMLFHFIPTHNKSVNCLRIVSFNLFHKVVIWQKLNSKVFGNFPMCLLIFIEGCFIPCPPMSDL